MHESASPPPGHVPPPAVAPVGAPALLEQSLLALGDAPGVFSAAAARPAPPLAAAASLAMSCGALALGVNAIALVVAEPRMLSRYPAWFAAAVSAAALGAFASAWLAAGVILYASGLALGGRGDFSRGVQAATVLSILAPVQAAANALPWVWPLPALWAGWVAAGALTGLFGARRLAARTLCGLFAAAAVGVQAFARALSARAPDLAAAAEAARGQTRVEASLQAALPAVAAPPPGAPQAAAPAGVSGLDLVRTGADEPAAPESAAAFAPTAPAVPGAAPAAAPAALQAQARGAEMSAVGMLDAMTPMLSNPQVTARMTRAQKAQFLEMNAMIKQLRDEMASGRAVPPAEMSRRVARIQQLALSLMSAVAAPPAPAPPAPRSSGSR